MPSRGITRSATLRHIFDGPDDRTPPLTERAIEHRSDATGRRDEHVLEASATAIALFVLAGGGTSFTSQPLPTDQFPLGSPLHLGPTTTARSAATTTTS